MSSPSSPPPSSDNNLINGKMNFDCSLVTNGQACTPNAGLAKFKFTKGKKHRFRLINASAEAIQRFTIDNHTMTVMANDFVPVKPYETNVVTLAVGQRCDVIVEAKLPAGSAVYMRSAVSKTCSVSQQPLALAAIYYDGASGGENYKYLGGKPRQWQIRICQQLSISITFYSADTDSVPKSTATAYDDSHCGNDLLDKTNPFFPFPSTPKPATTETIGITIHRNATGYLLWYMNESSFRANYNHPILLLANLGNTSYPFDPKWDVYNFSNNNSVCIIVENHSGAAHPMHLHGHNFNVPAEGPGPWDGTINHIQNTQRRDVQLIQPGTPAVPSHMVIQYNTDNPGVWPFHCHIAWHVSAGLYVNVMEQIDKIKQRVIPATIAQTCRDWADYTGTTVVAEIGSGL